MKINKEIRRLSRAMLRASFTDGQLDPGRIASLVDSLIAQKAASLHRRPQKLQTSASSRTGKAAGQNRDGRAKWIPTTKSELVANLKKKYGGDLTTEFAVDPALLGGMRIRVGSDVWDGTVRNRLERLQQEL